MPGGPRWDMGWGEGGGPDKQAERCSRFRGRSWKGGNTEAAPLLWCWRESALRSRNHVELSTAPQVRCVRCIFAASAAMLGTLGLLWHTPAGSEAQGKMARGWGRAPPRHSCNSHKTHQQNALARSTMQSPTAGMAAWRAGKCHGCSGGGRLETRQSHGFKISRLNLAGPCRRLDGLGCCPALRLLGSPFPDPSSTTTHTTHAHGTRRPSSSKRPWDDRVGASLLAFFPRWGPSSSASGVPHSCCSLTTTTVREQGCSAVLRLADGGRAVDGPSGINRSTTSTVFPPVYRPLMISGACRRLLPVPPRRVMPDRDITAPQSLAQGHGLARDRHGQLWMFELQKRSRHPPGPKKIHTTARRSGVCLADHSSPVNQAHHSCTPGWASRYGRRAFSDLLCASLQQRCIALKELDSPPISCSGAVDERISISRDRQDRQQRRDVPVCDRVRPSAAAAASGDAMWEGRRTGW